jgi:hypothetical protein
MPSAPLGFNVRTLAVSRVAECRIAGYFLGCLLALLVPGVLLSPALFGGLTFAALPEWALAVAAGSGALGLWHIATAALALEEDLEFITSYVVAQEAVPLVLPFVLYVGTRSVYRRLFAPALVARRRWQVRRNERLRREGTAKEGSAYANAFPSTLPREP